MNIMLFKPDLNKETQKVIFSKTESFHLHLCFTNVYLQKFI